MKRRSAAIAAAATAALAVPLLAILGAAFAIAQDGDHLISGPGSTLTENKCRICHELQHIRRAQLSPGEWADNLRNMKERGAPIDEAEFRVILEYLSVYYNREKPAPAPSPDTLAKHAADPAEELLSKNACNGCHAVDKRVVGPSFAEIAARYAGDAGAGAKLEQKIRLGGAGTWGTIPMPPNAGIPEGELKAMVGWVLARRP